MQKKKSLLSVPVVQIDMLAKKKNKATCEDSSETHNSNSLQVFSENFTENSERAQTSNAELFSSNRTTVASIIRHNHDDSFVNTEPAKKR